MNTFVGLLDEEELTSLAYFFRDEGVPHTDHAITVAAELMLKLGRSRIQAIKTIVALHASDFTPSPPPLNSFASDVARIVSAVYDTAIVEEG